MKTLWLIPVISLALSIFAFDTHAAAQVKSVRGEVQLHRNGKPGPLQKDTVLLPGDLLVAGKDAEIRVAIPKTSGELVLSSGSELRLDKLEVKDTGIEPIVDASITLVKGDMHGVLGRLSDLSKFEILLGNCRHQVGVGKVTRFALSADGTLRVRAGCITSLCDGKAGHTVCAGEKYVPSLGLVVAMTAPELTSPIWDIAAVGNGYPPQTPGPSNPTLYVNPLIGASISPSAPPAP